MAKSAKESYQEVRDAFRKNPSEANKKKFLEGRAKYIAQRRPKDKTPAAPKKKAAKKK